MDGSLYFFFLGYFVFVFMFDMDNMRLDKISFLNIVELVELLNKVIFVENCWKIEKMNFDGIVVNGFYV